MPQPPRVLVLGGRGFIGRHAVAALQQAGAEVTVGSRQTQAAGSVERLCLHEMTAASDWQDVVSRFDVVLNAVGILRQRWGETYDAVHHRAPSAIAAACKRANKRFVHVSALGLSARAKSRFLTSKVRGEQAIAGTGADWLIARLSLLDGDGGFGAAWLRGVARLPVFVVPTSARGRIAALTATDAGAALARLCLGSGDSLGLVESRIFELGGTATATFEGYIRGLRRRQKRGRALCVPVPGVLARLGAHICDVLHFSPFSFGHWELLCRDNVPQPNRLPELLGREPTPVI